MNASPKSDRLLASDGSQASAESQIAFADANALLAESKSEEAIEKYKNLLLEGDQQNGYQLVRLASGEVGWLEEEAIASITER